MEYELPDEIIEEIIKSCDDKTHRIAAQTCKLFNRVTMDIRRKEPRPLEKKAYGYGTRDYPSCNHFFLAICPVCKVRPVQLIKDERIHERGYKMKLTYTDRTRPNKIDKLDKIIPTIYPYINPYAPSGSRNISYMDSLMMRYVIGICKTCDEHYINTRTNVINPIYSIPFNFTMQCS